MAYTTLSAASLETYLMLERHRYGVAIGYSAGSIFGGVVASFIGTRLARAVG